MPASTQPKCPRIAVVTVHGVGDHRPNETAGQVTGLLMNLEGPGEHAVYTSFSAHALRLMTRRLNVEPEEPPVAVSTPEAKDLGPLARVRRWVRSVQDRFEERGPYLQRRLADRATEGDLDGGPEHGFMRDLLQEYPGEGPRDGFESVRLEGARLDEDGKRAADVHVYEMYWADLSRLGSGFGRILSELYQLLFHFSSLGRLTLDMARIRYGGEQWAGLGKRQAAAAWWLTLPIPILNLYLLVILLANLPGQLPETWQTVVALGIPAVASLVILGYVMLHRPVPRGWAFWLPPFLLVVMLAFSFWMGWLNAATTRRQYEYILAWEWCLLAGTLVWLLIRGYARRRPGADWLGGVLGVTVLVVFGMTCVVAWRSQIPTVDNAREAVLWASMATAEFIFLLLSVCWLIFCLKGSLLFWSSRSVPRGMKGRALAREAREVIRTAHLSLGLPAALFLILTLPIWTALHRTETAARLLKGVDYQPFITTPVVQPGASYDFLHALIHAGMTPLFVVYLLGIGLGALLVAWSLGPVVWAEVVPPQATGRQARMPGGDDTTSTRLGDWLTNGAEAVWKSGILVYSTVLLFPVGHALQLLPWDSPLESTLGDLSHRVLHLTGALLATATLAFLAFRGPLENAALGFRSVLDVLLDVDSYLREHPRDATPRARICARYASLLRYLCTWSDPADGRGYQAIVIIAHSQGSVITADLLRFLRCQRALERHAGQPDSEPVLARLGRTLPVYFFTVGCPLRQLYSLRFPHLYGWARHNPRLSIRGAAGAAPDPRHSRGRGKDDGEPAEEHWKTWRHGDIIPEKRAPDPEALGVELWVNAFRSGDYVGRYLWRPDRCDYHWLRPPRRENENRPWDLEEELPLHVSEDLPPTRREFCIGAGAHTHYFDKTAPLVAVELDRLISRASLLSMDDEAVSPDPQSPAAPPTQAGALPCEADTYPPAVAR